MHRVTLALILVFLLAVQAGSGQAGAPGQDIPPQPEISSPASGDALQGVVSIQGRTAVEGFRRAEVSFAYQDHPTVSWFLIAESESPAEMGALASWDTTTISDGEYTLRLVVFTQDGQEQVDTVEHLRVRNYSPVETDTPTPVPPSPIPEPSRTLAPPTATSTPEPTATPAPVTPTPLPTNPAKLSGTGLVSSAITGVLAVLAAFALLGLYLGIRQLTRRR